MISNMISFQHYIKHDISTSVLLFKNNFLTMIGEIGPKFVLT